MSFTIMLRRTKVSPARRPAQGYMLMGVLLMLSMLILVLATAAPRMTTQIERQREKDMVFRAKQYVIGIQRYYHKFGAYPPNLDRLKETNGVHYLRQAWRDPMTRNGKWFFIHYGQVPTGMMGGPGAPANPGLAGTPGGNLQPGGMMLAGDMTPAGGSQNSKNGEFGANLPGNSMYQGANNSGLVIETFASTNLNLNHGPQKPTGFGACRSRNQTGNVIGGGPIIGVASRDHEPGILEMGGHARPCKWAFIYDPSKDKTLHVMPGSPGGVGVSPAPPTGGILGGPTGGPPPPA